MKIYLDNNVFEASQDRLKFIFDNFERVYLSFSGGKDSSVMLNLTLDYMRANNIKQKIGVLVIDLEGQYKITINHILETIDKNLDLIEPYYICLPLNLRSAVSVFNPFWTCWDREQKDKWIRPMPDRDYVIADLNYFDFFKEKMEFEEFTQAFGKWFSRGKLTACLVGIRSDESLNRYRTIASKEKVKFKDKIWTTAINQNVFNCYPIYDWATQDIWVGNAKFSWDYNKVYDLFWKAGLSIANQRICQPYGDDQRIGLALFKVIEPQTWAKVVNRVSGANFGNIYCGEKIMGYGKITLPKNHTWKSYTKLLLATLPPELANHYKKRFIKFMKYWNKKGCPVRNNLENKLPDGAKILEKISTRGKKDKKLLIYTKINDCLDAKIESAKLAPTWRRMAICILKNDHLCKTISFTQTKQQQERMKELLTKYKNL